MKKQITISATILCLSLLISGCLSMDEMYYGTQIDGEPELFVTTEKVEATLETSEKILIITNVSQEMMEELRRNMYEIGIFIINADTSKGVAFASSNANSLSSSLTVSGNSAPYTITVSLYSHDRDSERWKGAGTYDVILYTIDKDNEFWAEYRAFDVSITAAHTIISADNFIPSGFATILEITNIPASVFPSLPYIPDISIMALTMDKVDNGYFGTVGSGRAAKADIELSTGKPPYNLTVRLKKVGDDNWDGSGVCDIAMFVDVGESRVSYVARAVLFTAPTTRVDMSRFMRSGSRGN